MYHLAANQGLAIAQFKLAQFYRYSTGEVKDETKAVMLYHLAADQGLASAQVKLGLCYENGSGVLKDEAKALELYRLAADQGHSCAQQYLRNLGLHQRTPLSWY